VSAISRGDGNSVAACSVSSDSTSQAFVGDIVVDFGITFCVSRRRRKMYCGHGDGFCGSNDPTNSVKALKEVVFLRIGFNPTRSTSPCYKPTHAHSLIHIIHAKMNLSTVKWAQ